MKKVLFLVNILCVVYLISFSINAQIKDPAVYQPRNQNDISHLPVANYDELEPTDSKEREIRKAKTKRYDDGKLGVLRKNPPSEHTGTAIFDRIPSPPAIPIVESEIIIIGEVLNAEAHLANNKGNVYSEFTIRVDEILKGNDSQRLTQGSLVIADRPGGKVQYSNGKRQFVRFAGIELPRIGSRYVLFLTNAERSPNYYILTGYEMMVGKVYPLDSGNSEKFEGMNKTEFIKKVQEALTQSSKTLPTN
jgi:hypothetical protein